MEDGAAPEPLPRKRIGLLDIVRGVLLVLVLAAVAGALWRNWSAVSGEIGRVGAGPIVGSLVVGLVSPTLTMLGWRVLLADLGSPLRLAPAAGVFFVGQLGKYVPGSVWSVLAQAEMAARLGIPRRRAGVVGLVLIGLSILTGGLVGLPALPLLLDRGGTGYPWWLILLAAVAGCVVLAPPVLNRLIGKGLALLRREPLEHSFSTRAVLTAVAWFVGAWVSMGLSVWVLARAVADPGTDAGRLALVGVCGFVLAATLGMVSFLVPAGVGVRDGLLLLVLTTVLGSPGAVAVVVLARFLNVVVDVIAAGAGWLWARNRHLLRAPGARVD